MLVCHVAIMKLLKMAIIYKKVQTSFDINNVNYDFVLVVSTAENMHYLCEVVCEKGDIVSMR